MRINVFNTKSNFLSKLDSSVISNEDISFIKDTKEIYTGGEFWQSGSSSSSIEIDSELNISSKNPVQNAVVTDAINKIQSVATEAKNNTTTLASSIENKVSQEEYNNKISEIESKINECITDKIIRILYLPEDGSDELTDEQKVYNAETYQMLFENKVMVGWSGGIFTIGDYISTGEPITLTAKFVMNNNILGGMFLSINVLLSSDGIVTPDEESIIECPMLCILNTPDWAAIYFNKGRYFSELRPCIVNPWSQMICYVDTIHASAPIVEYNLYDKRYRVTFDDSTYEIISTEEIPFGKSEIIIDSDLDVNSPNPVWNKTITNALLTKVDKVTGKGLSTNDYTTAEKNKLAGIAEGAEVNVQSDWNVTDSLSAAYIKNKPDLNVKQVTNDTHSETEQLLPNIFTIFTLINSDMVINLRDFENQSMYQHYIFQFTTGEILYNVNITNDIKWLNGYNILEYLKPNTTYQISILSGLAVGGEF